MDTRRGTRGSPEWLIVIGSSLFILVLWLSAAWEADIRWLHFFQAWMYVATIWLSVKSSRWGYFVGISAAGLWDYTNLFVTSFLINGLHALGHWMKTGMLARPDQLIAVAAWSSNLLVVIGCLWAYARQREKRLGDLAAFAAAFALTTAYFALDMAVCQPRYLPLFRGMLHPHLPRW